MRVTACIVTRGDVNLGPIFETLPTAWEVIVWDNGEQAMTRFRRGEFLSTQVVPEASVFGRYEAAARANSEVVYVQDDDCLVSEPQAIVDALAELPYATRDRTLVANMPQEFRAHYSDSCLVGFGAAFIYGLPSRVFSGWYEREHPAAVVEAFPRTCDVVFTGLVPERVLVDLPKQNLWEATQPGRMYRQPTHVSERAATLARVRELR